MENIYMIGSLKGESYFHNLFLLCAKLTIYTMLWTKLTIHTVK